MRVMISLLAIAAALIGSTGAARAQSDPFTVTGVRVDATAANAVDARTKAFGQAQQAALTRLAQQLSPDGAKGFVPPAPDQITPLVNDFEVTNEQLSATRYVGTYTFRFRPGPTRALIGAKMPAPPIAAASDTADPALPAVTAPAPTPAPVPTAMGSTDGVWHAASPAATGAAAVTVRADYASLSAWVAMQRAVGSVAGGAPRIVSVSPTEAILTIAPRGSLDAFRAQMAGRGYALSQPMTDGTYALSATAAGGR